MAAAITTLSTAGVPADLKAGYWSEALKPLFGPLRIAPFGADAFDSRIDHCTLARLRLCRLEGTPTRVMVSSPAASEGSGAHIRVLFQTEGISYFEQDGQKIAFGPGDCLAHDFSRPHSFTSPALTRVDSLSIPTELLLRRGMRFGGMAAKKIAGDTTVAIVHEFLDSLLRGAGAVAPAAAAVMADALFNLALLPFAHQTATPRGISHADLLRIRAKSFIENHLRDPDLGIHEIANALGCTKRYLHLVFQDEGTTIARFIWQSRVERCRQDLEAPGNRERSITEIAFSWGFCSSAHFSRLFKGRFGVTPSSIRPMGLSHCQ